MATVRAVSLVWWGRTQFAAGQGERKERKDVMSFGSLAMKASVEKEQ